MLREWLSEELNRRKWSHSELGRQANVSRALVTRVVSGDVPPSCDFCIKVAAALDLPPEKLLRLAGILPQSDDAVIQDILDVARNLPPEKRKEALRYLNYLAHN